MPMKAKSCSATLCEVCNPDEEKNRMKMVSFVAAGALSALALVPASAVPASAPTVPSITNIPVQVAHTSDGSVSYRSDGRGQPLVLIMGYSGSQDEWAPDFVNALATEHRVII